MMRKFLQSLSRDTSGAITVDWIVLTVAIAGLGIAVLASVSDETRQLADTTTYLIDLQPNS